MKHRKTFICMLLAAVDNGCIVAPVTELNARKPLPSSAEIAKLPSDGGPDFNRLVFEKSPYLLQHAANPVDWFSWGPAAFEKARNEDKPIFLSIGYSTCHWCHVMERESFEDEEVARILNGRFVAVKLDREERPDIDKIYMDVCIGMTGSGGWPLTIVMTPDQKPFFAGTYFPKRGAHGRPGLIDLLGQISGAWKEEGRRKQIFDAAGQIERAGRQTTLTAPGELPAAETLKLGAKQLLDRFDPAYGGFGAAPKFPSPHTLSFLLRWWKRSQEADALAMVEKTLTGMSRGGIHDHLGGGFHRYSTDPEWLVPHFEKMLYDQALLAIAYSEAFQAARNPLHGETARGILDYVLREMTAPEGGFYSAQDADSEGLEGKFYVWKPEEIRQALGAREGDLFCSFYDITPDGNFHGPHGPKACSIPHVSRPVELAAEELGLPAGTLSEILARGRKKLLEVRNRRIHPHKDDKILTDWNGLMIAALARGAQALDEPRYAQAAAKATGFLMATMRDKQGRLLHRYRSGNAAIPALLDDYAFLGWGVLDLYEATLDERWLSEAVRLNREMLDLFAEDASGALFMSGKDAETLLERPMEIYDGAIPSGNSVAALNLLRLARATGEERLQERAQEILCAFSGTIGAAPAAYAQSLAALDFALGPSQEVVIAGRRDDPAVREMLRIARGRFLPNKVLLFHPEGPEGGAIEALCPLLKDRRPIQGKATAYVCENHACREPVQNAEALARRLDPPRRKPE